MEWYQIAEQHLEKEYDKGDFKTTDFIQVEHQEYLDRGEPATFWRNALYVCEGRDHHTVIYTDGTKMCVHKRLTGIRKINITNQ